MTARAKAIAAVVDELEATLTPEAIADVVAELHARGLVGEQAGDEWITARVVAERIPFTAEWVRDRADALGARRIGEGTRPRLLFHWPTVQARLRDSGDLPATAETQPRQAPARKRAGGGDLLPIRGERPAA